MSNILAPKRGATDVNTMTASAGYSSIIPNCKEHVLNEVHIGDVQLKLIMFDGLGYEVHERQSNWGWGILYSDRTDLPGAEAYFEKAKRDHALVLAEMALDLDEIVECPDCQAIEGTPAWGTVGDGFDGYCPSCADARFNEDDDDDEDDE